MCDAPMGKAAGARTAAPSYGRPGQKTSGWDAGHMHASRLMELGRVRPASNLELDLDEDNLLLAVVDDVVLDSGPAKVGVAVRKVGRALHPALVENQRSGGQRHYDVVELVPMLAGGGTSMEAPLGHTDTVVVDLDCGDCARATGHGIRCYSQDP